MGKYALRVTAAALLLCTVRIPEIISVAGAQTTITSAGAQGADATVGNANTVPNRIMGYTAWDDEFLYVAVQVTKPALLGTNKEPFSDPLNDDAVVVAIQTDNDHKTTTRTARTVTLAVSEAGGTQLFTGEKAVPLFLSLKDLTDRLNAIGENEKDPAIQQSRRVALLGTIPKIQVTQIGAVRPGAGAYPGYTVEIAIPWSDLGGRPDVGARMGFNVAALSKAIGSPRVQSLAQGVHGVSDVDSPALWGEIVFAGAAKAGTALELTSPHVIASKPAIDGQLSENEWNRLSVFEFGERTLGGGARASMAATIASRSRPEFTPQPSRPVVGAAEVPAASPATRVHAPYHVAHMVFARYEYGYQGDARKDVPTEMVSNPDHSSALAHHPLDGAGPWFSYDRADWHRGQLAELRKDGVDVILPVYRADAAHRKTYADKGLLVLTTALSYLRHNGLDYPQVGLSLDTASLVEMIGDRLDMKDPASQDAFYSVIRNFYMRIPAEFRCCVAVDPTEGVRTAYPVFLTDARAFKSWDASVTSAIRSRFMADFNGADLILVGPSAFGSNAGLDSYVQDSNPNEPAVGGWIKTIAVGAGFDLDVARNFTPDAAALLPRRDGVTYRTAWTAAIARRPDWILLQNWNDYTLGGEIAPSLEAGFGASDLTRIYTHMFNGTEKIRSKFVWSDAPAAITPGSRFIVHVRVQNAGMETWGSSAPSHVPVNIAYRWSKNGQVVATDRVTVPTGTVLSGAEVTLPVNVQTVLKGAALSEGAYTLEIAAQTGKGGATGFEGGNTIQIPVAIGFRGTAHGVVTVLDTDIPSMMESGGVYPISAKLRNDSVAPWRVSDGCRVTARLYRISDGANGLVETPVDAADATAVLEKDIVPGDEATVHLLLPVTDPTGAPLQAWNQGAAYTYAIRWEVAAEHPGAVQAAVREGVPLHVAGFASTFTLVGITEFDFGVRFAQDGTLPTLPGERRQPVTLGVKNVGPQTWKRDSVRIGYHWYYEDGSEFLWEDETTALPQDVAPGGSVYNLLTYVTPPPCDGNYFLVWDVKFGDTWASTSAATRVFDQEVHPVQVTGGRLVFTDLAKAYNLDGVTDLSNPKDGDFDGKGRTFPAALIPPFTDDGVVPAGIWQPYDKTGPESPRHISFRWGSKEPRSSNFIVCRGQRVELGKYTGKCRVVHIVAASINANVTTNIKLVFQEPTGESEDLYAFSVSRWDQAPVNGEETVFTSKRYHDGSGTQDGAVSLYHYTFTIRDPRRIVALKLPFEPNIRIAAITLEK